MRMTSRALLSCLPIAALCGCGIFTPLGGTGSNDTTTNNNPSGFGTPTIEVTINGTHVGPTAPDSSSAARLTAMTNPQTGNVIESDFTVSVSSQSAGASCFIGATRQGTDGIAPFTVAGYQLVPVAGSVTPDGAAWPSPSESIGAAAGGWGCSGNDCNGGALVITALDAAHVEGYLSGTFPSSTGAGAADVVCSFYVPITN